MHRPRSPVRRRASTRPPLHCASALVLWVALFVSLPAVGDIADRDKPINLEADRMEVDDAKKVVTLTGNVVVTQGTMVIRSDRMVISQDAGGFNKGIAYGNPAKFRQKREGFDEYIDGQAQRMEYDGRNERLELFDKAVVKKGPEEVRGNYIAYDSRTEFYQVSGGGKDSSGREVQGRVRAVIVPKRKEDPGKPSGAAASTAVPLKPSADLSRPPER